MPIRDRISPFNPRPCDPGCYGVLVPLSQRYPPVAGRLHTRYAPVRRSPAVYCYTPLPLDLHVLGLPLAFILSQDQTLHCKNCSRNLLTRLVSETPGPNPESLDTRYLSGPISFKLLSPSLLLRHPLGAPPSLESGCKDTNIFQSAKIFFHFSLAFCSNIL